MYLASIVDSVAVSCHLLSQNTGPPATKKIVPSVNHLVL